MTDANAPEACYPYDPSACNTGYTEGWVNYNAAWNVSLAYLAADEVELNVSTDHAVAGKEVDVTLTAPLNMDATKQETGAVIPTYIYVVDGEAVATLYDDGMSELDPPAISLRAVE